MNRDLDDDAASLIWQHRSTLEVPKADRFDFWRQLPLGKHIQQPLETGSAFFGEFNYVATPDTVSFVEMGIDACLGRFGSSDGDWVDIGMVNAGAMYIRYGRGQSLVLSPSARPVVFDPTQPMTASTPRSDLVFLRLPRAAVVAAAGRAAMSKGLAVRPLAPGVLTMQLAACLQRLRRGREQTETATAQSLHMARALALVALARDQGAGHHWPDVLEQALYLAACHQLAQSLADPFLTADLVAAALGCSRAQLYRVFAAHGTSVAGYLYDLRMRRAAQLLVEFPAAAIGTLVMQCGYGGPIAFDKAFRRRFGMTPSDWRAERASAGNREKPARMNFQRFSGQLRRLD